MRVILERRGNRLGDPVTGEAPSPEQAACVRDRVERETYIAVPGVGICEPVESLPSEDIARDRMTTMAAKHEGERFTLVMAVDLSRPVFR